MMLASSSPRRRGFSRLALVGLFGLFGLAACRTSGTDAKTDPSAPRSAAAETRSGPTRRVVGTAPGGVGAGTPLAPQAGHELAAFAAGCFWGVEDNFRQVPGVVATAVGYTGGRTTNPTYESVCGHTTGHAETVIVEFEPAKVSYEDLLRIFFMNHDPTTKNRQGPDVGDQYRSAIFSFTDAQMTAARAAAQKEEARLGKPVTTEIAKVGAFWKAEEYHQQYDEKTGTHSCPMPRGVTPNGT
jgi:peptide-methionine (S)-S-oxide reductase